MNGRKIVATAAISLLAGGMLAGCSNDGGSSACVGTWKVSAFEQNGERIEGKQAEELLGIDLGDFMKIDLADGGKATVTVMDESIEGTWKGTDNTCAVTVEDDTLDLSVVGDELKADVDGQTVYLTK